MARKFNMQMLLEVNVGFCYHSRCKKNLKNSVISLLIVISAVVVLGNVH